MTSRIGIMGGMFDPVHNGHVDAALAVVQLLNLDELRMVPCGIPNHRGEANCTSRQRLEMLNLATRAHPIIKVDPRELTRSGVSYTYDTLESIKQESSSSILFFVLGVDAFYSLPQWHRWQELFNFCHFVVVNRPGFESGDDVSIANEIENRQVESASDLVDQEFGKIFFLRDFNIDLSSTQIREKIGHGISLESDLAPDVVSYMIENELYGIQTKKSKQEVKIEH